MKYFKSVPFFILTAFIISTDIVYAQKEITFIKLESNENAPIISKHIYGHFAEHLGRSIYEGFYVGENSTIPNSEGVRTDIINALKELQIPNLRWPGGCFADTYHWMDGIGPKAVSYTHLRAHETDSY